MGVQSERAEWACRVGVQSGRAEWACRVSVQSEQSVLGVRRVRRAPWVQGVQGGQSVQGGRPHLSAIDTAMPPSALRETASTMSQLKPTSRLRSYSASWS